jgi:hypothetical protein
MYTIAIKAAPMAIGAKGGTVRYRQSDREDQKEGPDKLGHVSTHDV